MESPYPDEERHGRRAGSGISLQTLIIASVASAAASFAASRIWGPGTLVSAAATPVVVALVSELLRHPVHTVASSVPTVHTLRGIRTRTNAAAQPPPEEDPATGDAGPLVATPAERRAPSERPDAPHGVEPTNNVTPNVPATMTEHTGADAWHPRWRLAIVTGLLAFTVVVAVYTVPDLVAGRSITGNGQPTTFFGGSANVKNKPRSRTIVTTTTPTTTVTKTAPATTSTSTTTTRSTSTTTTTTSTTTAATTTTPATTTPPAATSATTPTTPPS